MLVTDFVFFVLSFPIKFNYISNKGTKAHQVRKQMVHLECIPGCLSLPQSEMATFFNKHNFFTQIVKN